jgi:hypothetical protein
MKAIITKENGETKTVELENTDERMLEGRNEYTLAERMYYNIYPNADDSRTATKNADGSFLVRDHHETENNTGGITVRFEVA